MVRVEKELPGITLICIVARNLLHYNQPSIDLFAKIEESYIHSYDEIRKHVSIGEILKIINHAITQLKK